MEITATIGEENVEASESLFLPHGYTNFAVNIEDIHLSFEFIGDANDPSIKGEPEGTDKKKIKVTLINWNNSLGTTNVFRDIAFIDDKAVNFFLTVVGVNGGDGRVARRITYTITSRAREEV